MKKEKIRENLGKILWIIIGILLGILLTEGYHYVTATSDAVAFLEPLTNDDYGAYFPVKVINTGDKTLNQNQVEVKTCYMDYYKQIGIIPKLKKGTDITLRFSEEKTMSLIPKKQCLKGYNFSFHDCEINAYIINSTNLYVPQGECSIYLCDFCSYSIKIKSDDLKEEKIFTYWFMAPKEIKMSIKPKVQLSNINITNLKKFSSLVGFNLLTPLERCLYNESCPFMEISSTIEDKETYLYKFLLHYLYPFNISVTVPPKRELYNYGNFTIFIDYTDSQKKEIFEKGFDFDDFEIVVDN